MLLVMSTMVSVEVVSKSAECVFAQSFKGARWLEKMFSSDLLRGR